MLEEVLALVFTVDQHCGNVVLRDDGLVQRKSFAEGAGISIEDLGENEG